MGGGGGGVGFAGGGGRKLIMKMNKYLHQFSFADAVVRDGI